MRFDITDLRLFLATIEGGSITRGADRSALTLASASARIRGMEEALGAPLLERGRRGVVPTSAGRALEYHARLILAQIERMQGELAEYGRGLRGHVRLMSNSAALAEHLPKPLADFLVNHPQIDIDVDEQPSHAIGEAVARGSADIGVLADWAVPDGLQATPFALDRLVLVGRADHPLLKEGRGAIAFGDALDEDFVGFGAMHPLQVHIAHHAARAGRPQRLRARLPGFDAVCEVAATGVGIAIVPEAAARRHRRALPIRMRRLSDSWALRQIMLCVRSFEALPAPARELLRHLTSCGTGRLGKSA